MPIFRFPRNRAVMPFKQRGILGFKFSSDRQKGVTTEDANVDRRTTQTTKQTQKDTQKTTGTAQQEVTQLPQEVQDILVNLIKAQAGQLTPGEGGGPATGGELANVAQQLLERAEGAESALNSQNAATLSEARRKGSQEIGRGVTELATAAGSSQNSFVQQSGLEAQTQLESSLAALNANLNIEARNTASKEFVDAANLFGQSAQAGGQSTGSLANLVQQLRGGTTVTTDETQQNVTGESTLDSQQKLQEIVKALTVGTSKTKSKGFSIFGSAGKQG